LLEHRREIIEDDPECYDIASDHFCEQINDIAERVFDMSMFDGEGCSEENRLIYHENITLSFIRGASLDEVLNISGMMEAIKKASNVADCRLLLSA
jgi:NifU-like protein involved in Fe-S cluster formation